MRGAALAVASCSSFKFSDLGETPTAACAYQTFARSAGSVPFSDELRNKAAKFSPSANQAFCALAFDESLTLVFLEWFVAMPSMALAVALALIKPHSQRAVSIFSIASTQSSEAN